MQILFKNAHIFEKEKFRVKDLLVAKGRIAAIAENLLPTHGAAVIDLTDKFLLPGLVDVHVHLREPGFCYKETIESGTLAAAAGGYATVCAMPNLNPAPDSLAHLAPQLEAVERGARVRVVPYGTITQGGLGGELSAMDELAPYVVAFTDDGKGVQDRALMRAAMLKARGLGKMIVAHCEDDTLLQGGYLHDGDYARAHGHPGISSASEWRQVERDLALVRETGCAYHVCHVSAKESVALLRRAKAEGLDVSCETAPHYLTLSDAELRDDGRFKMNPPIRGAEDREALIEGVLDGTIDMIATDHAPHSAEEKSRGLQGSLMGVVGLETAFPVLYTKLVEPGVLTLERLVRLMSVNPGRRFGLGGRLVVGQPADLAIFDLNATYTINPQTFRSQGRATPFAGWEVKGKCVMTIVNGRTAWPEHSTEK